MATIQMFTVIFCLFTAKTSGFCFCNDIFDPVCCEGSQYSSLCNAECDGFTERDCYADECGARSCTQDLDPYCCKGNFYSNECVAGGYGYNTTTQCSNNQCGGCICTSDYDPYCCDNSTYSNECNAICDGFLDVDADCTAGICTDMPTADPTTAFPSASPTTAVPTGSPTTAVPSASPTTAFPTGSPTTAVPTVNPTLCICNFNYDPVCCKGTTYGNQCGAECDGFTEDDCYAEACGTGDCIQSVDPVCCNGNDYTNDCYAKINGFNVTSQCIEGQCGGVCVCTAQYDPYCCDGEEYSSDCRAACDGYLSVDDDCIKGICPNTTAMPTMMETSVPPTMADMGSTSTTEDDDNVIFPSDGNMVNVGSYCLMVVMMFNMF